MRFEVNAAPAAPDIKRRDAPNRLLAALFALAQGHGALLRHDEKPWASITFTGSRHFLTIRFAGTPAVEAGEVFVAGLPDHEFAIPRRLVADACVLAVRHTLLPEPVLEVDCEVLLLDED